MNKESKKDNSSQDKQSDSDGSPIKNTNYVVPLLILAGLLVFLLFNFQNNQHSTISYGYFRKLIKGHDFNGKPILGDDGEPIRPLVEDITWTPEGATGIFTVIPAPEPIYKDGKLTQADPAEKLQQRFRVDVPDNEVTRNQLDTELQEAGVKSINSAKPSNMLDVLGTILMLSLIHISEPTRPY